MVSLAGFGHLVNALIISGFIILSSYLGYQFYLIEKKYPVRMLLPERWRQDLENLPNKRKNRRRSIPTVRHKQPVLIAARFGKAKPQLPKLSQAHMKPTETNKSSPAKAEESPRLGPGRLNLPPVKSFAHKSFIIDGNTNMPSPGSNEDTP